MYAAMIAAYKKYNDMIYNTYFIIPPFLRKLINMDFHVLLKLPLSNDLFK